MQEKPYTLTKFLGRNGFRKFKRSIRRRSLGLFLHLAMKLKNRFSRSSIVGDGKIVVNLTTYGNRINTAFEAIESIGTGDLLPERIILWLSDADATMPLPKSLKRLKLRGLEIKSSFDYRSHKKYYPYIAQTDILDRPIVTADDDVYYPRYWLKGLEEAAGKDQIEHVICYRSRVAQGINKTLLPYKEWPLNTSPAGHPSVFPIGVSGVLYPTSVQNQLKYMGEHFLDTCLTADDLWLHHATLESGYVARQIGNADHFIEVRTNQSTALSFHNVETGNDEQIRRVYTEENIKRIIQASDSGSNLE